MVAQEIMKSCMDGGGNACYYSRSKKLNLRYIGEVMSMFIGNRLCKLAIINAGVIYVKNGRI